MLVVSKKRFRHDGALILNLIEVKCVHFYCTAQLLTLIFALVNERFWIDHRSLIGHVNDFHYAGFIDQMFFHDGDKDILKTLHELFLFLFLILVSALLSYRHEEGYGPVAGLLIAHFFR